MEFKKIEKTGARNMVPKGALLITMTEKPTSRTLYDFL